MEGLLCLFLCVFSDGERGRGWVGGGAEEVAKDLLGSTTRGQIILDPEGRRKELLRDAERSRASNPNPRLPPRHGTLFVQQNAKPLLRRGKKREKETSQQEQQQQQQKKKQPM